MAGRPRIDGHGEQQHRHLQAGDQHDRAVVQGYSNEDVAGDVPETAQPPATVAHQHAEQRQVAYFSLGNRMSGTLTDHDSDRGRQRAEQGQDRRG